MKTADNKEIIRLFVEDVENTGDVTIIQEFIAEDYTEAHESTERKIISNHNLR